MRLVTVMEADMVSLLAVKNWLGGREDFRQS